MLMAMIKLNKYSENNALFIYLLVYFTEPFFQCIYLQHQGNLNLYYGTKMIWWMHIYKSNVKKYRINFLSDDS